MNSNVWFVQLLTDEKTDLQTTNKTIVLTKSAVAGINLPQIRLR